MKYEGKFPEQWPPAKRGQIVNWFCYAVRSGAKSPESVLSAVARVADDSLLAVIDSPEAREFAEYILWRESLPENERLALKREKAAPHVLNWMSKQPPTNKQLSYLDALGCHVIPANKAEASQLIEKYRSGNGDV